MPDAGFTSYTSDRPVRRRSDHESAPPAHVHQHPLLRLQGQAGNAAVARMIQRESEGPEAEEEELQAKHDPAIQRESEGPEAEEEELQAKHDPAIQRESEGPEAEEEELQAKHDPAIQRESEGPEAEGEELQAKHDPAIQREDEGDEGEDEEIEAKHDPAIQRRADVMPQVGLEGGPVGPELEARISAKRGSGAGLSPSVRTSMERAMNTSFADVRVHRDAESDYLNRAMTAKAFTTGSDIFLREDVSESDTDTMAHELHHVTQQRGMSGGGGGGMRVGAADDSHEHEADAAAAAVRSGEPVQRHHSDDE